MRSRWILAAALAGFTGVALGAFGAHGLEGRASAEQLAWWETGVRYHLVHALALFGVGLLPIRGRLAAAAGGAFVFGTVVFSGTLYGLGLGGPRWLGAVTPIGGVGFLVGWALLARLAWCAGRREPPPGATLLNE